MMPSARTICSHIMSTCLLFVAAHWTIVSTAAAANVPDFDLYNEILLQNVLNGFVNYDQIGADSRFASFVEQLGSADIEMPETDGKRLALYINAYNAFAIQGILNGESPAGKWGRRSFLKRQKYSLGGQAIGLESLASEKIFPIGDPRVHFAIVCASLSCPRLSGNAYQFELINVQLHDAAKRFINDSTRNRFDLDRRIAFLSKIFEWHAEDFEAAGGSTQRYLARFVNDAQVQDALRRDEFEVRYLEYDWSLNGRFNGKD
jgi:hypothetical protein